MLFDLQLVVLPNSQFCCKLYMKSCTLNYFTTLKVEMLKKSAFR